MKSTLVKSNNNDTAMSNNDAIKAKERSSWSRKVSTLRQDVEESRADTRKRPSTTANAISHELDSEEQEHQVRINRIKII